MAQNLDVPLWIAQSMAAQRPKNILPLFDDDSAADPTSVDPAVLITNWTGQRDQDYTRAAE